MAPIPNRDSVPRTEVPEMHWKSLSLGVMRLAAGPASLSVRAVANREALSRT
jgi:hypothetical protein